MKDKKILKAPSGAPAENDNASQAVQNNKGYGYTLLQDNYLVNKLAHFNRERTPERVVHAKGAGAHGYFILNKAMKEYTDAKIFNELNKKVPLFIRFSTVGGESGSADAARDPRGFAIKFYTDDGNYDIVGNNTPIFFIRDAIKFPDFIHTQKRHPQTNLKDANMMWDFWSQTPESLHQVMFLFSERGVPKNYREMHGYGSHTFMWYKKDGSYVWVKYHFRSTLGFNGMTNQEALEMTKNDPDHATRDLFEAIENKNYPKWTVQVQIMTPEQAKSQELNPFDVTKVWSHKDFPVIEIGEIVLDRNPENYFVEVEQVAFTPANFVPGVGPSPDKLLQGRFFAYGDAHRYRVGPNSEQLPINKPLKCPYSNQRGGHMANAVDYGASNNYFPNSQADGAVIESYPMPIVELQDAWINREFNQEYEQDFAQPHDFYNNVLTPEQKNELTNNLAGNLSGAALNLQYRQTTLFYKVAVEFGSTIANKLKLDLSKIEQLAKLSQEQLVANTPFAK